MPFAVCKEGTTRGATLARQRDMLCVSGCSRASSKSELGVQACMCASAYLHSKIVFLRLKDSCRFLLPSPPGLETLVGSFREGNLKGRLIWA